MLSNYKSNLENLQKIKSKELHFCFSKHLNKKVLINDIHSTNGIGLHEERLIHLKWNRKNTLENIKGLENKRNDNFII